MLDESCVFSAHLPTELIIYILKFLSVKNLVSCRRVCKRWKEIVDEVTNDESMWEAHCKRDFKTLYQDAKRKTISCYLWFDIYRSLNLWSLLQKATEVQDEFCHSKNSNGEIQDIAIVENGLVLVHIRYSVIFYNVSNLELSRRSAVEGDFIKYIEFGDIVIIIGNFMNLQIIRKIKPEASSRNDQEEVINFTRIRDTLMIGKYLYLIHCTNSIMCCNLKSLEIKEVSPPLEETVSALSWHDGKLHILTAEGNVYVYIDYTFVIIFNLESKKNNIFDCLWRYQFLQNINWFVFYYLIGRLEITLPESPLKYISTMKVYGDVFFVGCKNGIFLIYYKPYVDGKLDFFEHKPVKQYHFSDQLHFPALSLHPILKIDIAEVKGGHKVFIAMPKKVITLMFTHSFAIVKSTAVVPYVPIHPAVVESQTSDGKRQRTGT